MTFDGRWLTTIEGRRLGEDEEAAPGEAVVNMLGDRIVPGDGDDADDIVTAISFDYVALDATRWPEALFEAGMAENVEEFRQATRGFIGSALFMSAVDDGGNIFYTTYQAVPCRTYLPRTDGVFAAGADPTKLLDGTRYGGFTIGSDANGKADESQNATDPSRCVIPLDVMPHAINPPSGYVFNANSDPAGLTDDGDERNGLYHIGGPWSSVRAHTIRRDLDAITADRQATPDDLMAMQGNIDSRLGELFVPFLLQAIERAQGLVDGTPVDAVEERLQQLAVNHAEVFEAVAQRLDAWGARGFVAHSGVETFYATPTTDERADAIATMIFNAWFPRFMDAVWGDENVQAWRWGSESRVAAIKRMLDGRGPDNPGQMASWDAETQEGVFFDRVGTEVVEHSDELMLGALTAALSFLESPVGPDGTGGFGTNDMEAWLWGLRHVAKFQSILGPYLAGAGPLAALGDAFSITTRRLPLMPQLANDDPRKALKWFPRGGDQWSVDAANPGFSGVDFTYGAGPAMRIVMALKDGEVRGGFALPGGLSGLTSSEHFDDLVQLWLGNEFLPIHFGVADVVAAATKREIFVPAE
jgi:penicillin amidase